MRRCLQIAVAAALAATPVLGQNLIVNSRFDTNLAGWKTDGMFHSSATWSSLDVDSSPTSGSAMITAFIGGNGIWQEMRVVAGETYELSAQLRMLPGGASGSSAWVQVVWAPGPGINQPCSGAALGTVSTPHTTSVDVWEAVSLSDIAPAGAGCARVRVAVTANEVNPHTAHADNVDFRRTGTTGSFHTVTPCRLVDTRTAPGPLGGPALTSPGTRDFPVAGNCGIPPGATAVAANLTVISPSGAGHLKAYPAGETALVTSALNFEAGVTKANIAILTLGVGGQETVSCHIPGGGTADLLVDVTGYFL